MYLSTKHLEAAGFHVTVSQDGRDLKGEFLVEVHAMRAEALPPEIMDEIEKRVGPEYAPALFEALASKIHTVQILEAINKTEGQAWRDRSRKRNGEAVLEDAFPRTKK